MPKLSPNAVPSYRLHKQSGQAIVTLSGRDFLLGQHGSDESREKYNRLVAEWVANGRRSPRPDAGEFSIIELIAAFWKHAEGYYRNPDGTPGGELENFRLALKPLKELYGMTRAADFGPLRLKAVREKMVAAGWCRNVVNRQTARIKQVFKWAAENELVPASVHHGLSAVAGLRRGRSEARESEPVKPVPEAHVNAALPFLSPQVAAMVNLQCITGMRPGEVIAMRGADIDRAGAVWVYRPAGHKTAHHGHQREIYLGKRAQEVLTPFLKPDPLAFLFTPADAEAERLRRKHETRKTPLSCGNRPGTNRKARRKRPPGDCYDVAAYRRAIARACDRADREARQHALERREDVGDEQRIIPVWHPHQLRHNAATRLRKDYGLEVAQVILGHKTLTVTQVYAEKNIALARQVMAQVG